MKITQLNPNFEDSRGTITDVLSEITLIKSIKGSVRGNHYHKLTTQWVYVVSGELRYYWKNAAWKEDGSIGIMVAREGDLIETSPNEPHAYEMLSDTQMLVITKGPRNGSGYELDTYRLDYNLCELL